MSDIITLTNVRLAFPALFTPEAYQDGPPQFKASFMAEIGSPAYAVIDAEVKRVATEKWKDKATTVLKQIEGNTQKCCWIEGERRHASFTGGWVLSALRNPSDGAPKIVDQNPNIHLSAERGKIYSGCYVNARVQIWAQDNTYGKAMRATLVAVQFAKDGDAWSATPPASADGFADLSTGADAMALT